MPWFASLPPSTGYIGGSAREAQSTLLTNHTSHLRLKDKRDSLTSPGFVSWLIGLPGNEVLNVSVHTKELAIPRLAKRMMACGSCISRTCICPVG